MTQKQKEAIEILFNLLVNDYVNKEEYYKLLEFVIEDKSERTTYYPIYYPWWNTGTTTWTTNTTDQPYSPNIYSCKAQQQ